MNLEKTHEVNLHVGFQRCYEYRYQAALAREKHVPEHTAQGAWSRSAGRPPGKIMK